MNTAYIMRGVPGSGKSETALTLAAGNHAAICSTDSYFYDAEGEYTHDVRKLSEYHSKNLERFMQNLREGVPVVICDNTNIRYNDYRHYIVAAQFYNYRVAIVAMLPHPDHFAAAKRCIHSVPADQIRRMIEAWEP